MNKFTKRGLTYNPRILISGDTGFLANNTIPYIKEVFPKADLILPQGAKFFDLTKQNHVKVMFDNIKNVGFLDVVVHMAALSGGIADNMARQASYAYQNSMMLWNIIEECAASRVKKVVLFMGSCGYPATLESPMKEEDFWNGLPVESSIGYSMAKKMGYIAALTYNKQFGLDVSCLMPSNIFGPFDNFDEKNSHVIPGLISKFIEARDEGYGSVTIWGDGTPQRDFLYAEDVGKLVPHFIKYHRGDVTPINIASGVGTSISEVAELIMKAVGFKGRINYDTSKPAGQAVRILDTSRLKNFLTEYEIDWIPTPMEEAIAKTVEWYDKRK